MKTQRNEASELASLQEFYPYDSQTRELTICVAVDRYEGIFNPIDPSPLRQRDLSPYFRDYIQECSEEIPAKYPVALSIEIAEAGRDAAVEQEVATCIRHFFQFQLRLCDKELRAIARKALRYLLISAICLLVSFVLPEAPGPGIGQRLGVEGLTIGGWVFMWQAISDLFISNDDLRARRAQMKRLVAAAIRFLYPAEDKIPPTH